MSEQMSASFSPLPSMANMPCKASDENVLPFHAITADDIPDFDSTDLITCMAMFYPNNDRSEPDMRVSLGNTAYVKIMQIFDLAMRTRVKPVEAIVVSPKSMVMMFRISADMWCMIIFIFTPAPLAIHASASLGSLLTERQRPTTFRMPLFMQSPSILYDIRNALNIILTAAPATANTAYLPPPIAPHTNISPSEMTMIPAAGAVNLTRERAILLCGRDTPLCLFTALGIPQLVTTLEAIHDHTYSHVINNFIQWTTHRGQFVHPHYVFAMTIPDIITLLRGQSTAPICVSDAYITAAIAMAGGVLPVPYDRNAMIDNMMYERSMPYRRGGGRDIICRFMPPSPPSVELCSLFPPWMHRMDFMTQFQTDVLSDWRNFNNAFEAVYKRVMMRTLETPGWIVAAFAGMVKRPCIPYTTTNPDDLFGRSSNIWWPVYGDVTGTYIYIL